MLLLLLITLNATLNGSSRTEDDLSWSVSIGNTFFPHCTCTNAARYSLFCLCYIRNQKLIQVTLIQWLFWICSYSRNPVALKERTLKLLTFSTDHIAMWYSALLLGKTALKLKVSTWVLWRGFELQWCSHLPNICFSNKLRAQLTCIWLSLCNLYVYGTAAAPINTSFPSVLLLACSWLSISAVALSLRM